MRNLSLFLSPLLIILILTASCDNKSKNNDQSNAPALKMPDDVKILVEKLESSDPNIRVEALKELGEMGSKAISAIPHLVELLNDSSKVKKLILPEKGIYLISDVGIESKDALVKIGDRSVDPLIKALSDSNPNVRWKAVLALRDIGDKRAVEPLILCLTDESSDVRWRAASSLGELKDERALEPLKSVLNDPDQEVREKAEKAISLITSP